MATKVLDSHALMAFFNDESGADEVERMLLKADAAAPSCLCVSSIGARFIIR